MTLQRIACGLCLPAPGCDIGYVAVGPTCAVGTLDFAGDPFRRQQNVSFLFGHELEIVFQPALLGVEPTQPSLRIGADQDLGWHQTRQFAVCLLDCGRAAELAAGEFARAHIGVCEADMLFMDIDGRDVVVGGCIEDRAIDDSSGCDDTNNLPFDHAFPRGGSGNPACKHRAWACVAFVGGGFDDLLRHSDAVAGSHQFGHICLDGVIGHASHRAALLHTTVLTRKIFVGQGDIEQGCNELGIVVEAFVEVTKPIKQHGVGLAGFEFTELRVPLMQRQSGELATELFVDVHGASRAIKTTHTACASSLYRVSACVSGVEFFV